MYNPSKTLLLTFKIIFVKYPRENLVPSGIIRIFMYNKEK